jgi:hypothetical protein
VTTTGSHRVNVSVSNTLNYRGAFVTPSAQLAPVFLDVGGVATVSEGPFLGMHGARQCVEQRQGLIDSLRSSADTVRQRAAPSRVGARVGVAWELRCRAGCVLEQSVPVQLNASRAQSASQFKRGTRALGPVRSVLVCLFVVCSEIQVLNAGLSESLRISQQVLLHLDGEDLLGTPSLASIPR